MLLNFVGDFFFKFCGLHKISELYIGTHLPLDLHIIPISFGIEKNQTGYFKVKIWTMLLWPWRESSLLKSAIFLSRLVWQWHCGQDRLHSCSVGWQQLRLSFFFFAKSFNASSLSRSQEYNHNKAYQCDPCKIPLKVS